MEGVAAWLPIISIAFTIISGMVLLVIQYRQGKDKLSADTFKKMNDALDVRETTINDLKDELAKKDAEHIETIEKLQTEHAAEIKDMQSKHALEIKGLQAQITGLQEQITALTSKNKVLEDSVTGKVYLEKILEILTAFQPLLDKNGILQEFKADHAEAKDILTDIQQRLKITKRVKDHGTVAPRN